MKLEIIAVKDRALDAFMRPFFAQSIGQAIRMFQDEVNRADGEINKHPDDYDLYHLGSFEDSTGDLIPTAAPKQIAIAKQLLTK